MRKGTMIGHDERRVDEREREVPERRICRLSQFRVERSNQRRFRHDLISIKGRLLDVSN